MKYIIIALLLISALFAEVTYKKTFYKNGQVKVKTPYVNGKKEGVEELYYKDGRLKGISSYKSGVKEGVVALYDEHGKMVSGYIYMDGKKSIKVPPVDTK